MKSDCSICQNSSQHELDLWVHHGICGQGINCHLNLIPAADENRHLLPFSFRFLVHVLLIRAQNCMAFLYKTSGQNVRMDTISLSSFCLCAHQET